MTGLLPPVKPRPRDRYRIGIVDTTFARVDMAQVAIEEIRRLSARAEIVRRTVPGVKDTPAEARRLLDEGCDILMVFGWVSRSQIDKTCAHEACQALMLLRVFYGRHIVEVFVHEDEAEDEKALYQIAINRAREHAQNVVLLMERPHELTRFAGKGLRQGVPDVGPLRGE